MILSTVLLLASATLVLGHGRVTQPPSRASAWRLGFPTPANYDDDGLNCGGFSTQWSSNGGKCGICGDAYSIPPPRPHELGGTYGLGVIVAKYLPGATIATTTHLTASHMGYWEFKLCPDPSDNNQECFDKHILVSEDGETKYTPKRGSGIYEVNYKLPSGLICEHCVLQWRYVAGNNWGICSNGTSGLGCGNQEEFRACSDIAIGVSKTLGDVGNIPSPLLFYLQNGYFELDQGYLIRKDPKRPTAPRRPTKNKPSNRQPKISNQPSQNSVQPHPLNRYPQPKQQQAYPGQSSKQHAQPSKRQPQASQQQPYPLQQQLQNSKQNHQPSQQYRQTSQQTYLTHQQPQTSKHNHPPSQQYRQLSQQSYPSHQQPQTSKPQPSKQPYPPQQPQQKSQPLIQYQPQKQQLQSYQPSKQYSQSSIRPSQPSQQPHSKRPPDLSNKQHQSSKRQKSSKRHPNSGRYEYKTSEKRRTKKAKNKKKKKNGRGNQKKRSQRYKYL